MKLLSKKQENNSYILWLIICFPPVSILPIFLVIETHFLAGLIVDQLKD